VKVYVQFGFFAFAVQNEHVLEASVTLPQRTSSLSYVVQLCVRLSELFDVPLLFMPHNIIDSHF